MWTKATKADNSSSKSSLGSNSWIAPQRTRSNSIGDTTDKETTTNNSSDKERRHTMSVELGSSIDESLSPRSSDGSEGSPSIGPISPATRPTLNRLRTLVRLASVVSKLGAAAKDNVVSDPVWVEERECLILLLKARMMLRDMIENRLKQERIESGRLSVFEIQNLLKNQKEDIETDWIAGNYVVVYIFSFLIIILCDFNMSTSKNFIFPHVVTFCCVAYLIFILCNHLFYLLNEVLTLFVEIQELKRNIVAEVRKNHQLERDLTKLDKRIALLIKHRSSIKELLAATQKKRQVKDL